MNSTDESIKGVWKNEYGSKMTIDEVSQGTFKGEYSSTTGDTGTYKVVGVYDTAPAPDSSEQTVAFAISWRSLDGAQGDYMHASSGFSGQIQHNGLSLIMPVIHILSSPHEPANAWENSLVDKLTFVKQEE